MTKHLKIFLSAAIMLILFLLFMRTSTGAGFLWDISDNGRIFFPLVTVAALIDSINPCAFSILLVTIGFLLSLGKSRREVLSIGGAYIGGILAVYLLIGLGILQVLHFFDTPHFMAKLGAAILLVLGALSLIQHFFLNSGIKIGIPASAHARMAVAIKQASVPGAFTLGALVGLCEFPCTGGPYLMILGMLHDGRTYTTGLWYLLWYNLVFITPLIVILGITGSSDVLARIRTWKAAHTGKMRLYTGIAMLLLGLAMLSF